MVVEWAEGARLTAVIPFHITTPFLPHQSEPVPELLHALGPPEFITFALDLGALTSPGKESGCALE